MTDTFRTDFEPFFINDDVGSASQTIVTPGFMELGTGTGSAFTMSAAPYVGALVGVCQTGTATTGKTLTTNSTAVTLDGAGSRTITFDAEGDSILLLGISTTRWQVLVNANVALT